MTIYFAHMGDWIKIGYTAGEATKRIAQLQTGQPQKITLLGTIAGERDAEAGLHKYFSDFRGNGEWFDADPVMSVASYLIEKRLPWYYCRVHAVSDKIWEGSFRLTSKTDSSAYEDVQVSVPSNKKLTFERVAYAIQKQIQKSRLKRGIDPRYELGICDGIGCPCIIYQGRPIPIPMEYWPGVDRVAA